MNFTALLIGLATVLSTLLGGLFAIRFRDKLHLILGFSAGAVIGVAFFDLIPESITLGSPAYSISTITLFMAAGFTVFMVIDRFFSLHLHAADDLEHPVHHGNHAAFSLCLHSFLDGLGIGLAFKVSPVVGGVVAAAVLAHDFSDGINTVNIILKNDGKRRRAFGWLIVDALAPILGIISTFFFTVSEAYLGLVLAVFSGLFLYLGASDLIPESHHRHPTLWTTLMTLAGIASLGLIIHFAG